MTLKSSLRFLYIFGRYGLLCAMALHRVLHNYAQSSSTIGVGIIPIKKGALSLIVHLPSHANSQVAWLPWFALLLCTS